MASMVARAAAALPSVRVKAVPGQGAAFLPGRRGGGVVLAVRRDGTGILSVEFKVPSPRSSWAVKSTDAESDYSTEGGDSEEHELVRDLKAILARNIKNSIKVALFDANDVRWKYYQFMLGQYAMSIFELWANATNKFRPSTETKLYEGLKLCGDTLVAVAVRCSEGQATWKNMSDVVEAMELLRRLVSSTLEAPLPQDWDASRQEDDDNAKVGLILWDASHQGGDDAEVGLILVLQRTYALVWRDIKGMLGAN